LLTAATGFVAALSGLVAGLNQLGVFRHDQPAPQVVGTAPAPRDSSPAETAAESPRASSSSTAPAAESGRGLQRTPASAPTPARPPVATPTRPVMPAAPSGGPDSTHRAAPSDSAQPVTASTVRLPKGTALELEVPARTCAPSDGARRFTARMTSAVKAGPTTVLPEGATAILHVRGGSDKTPQVRLDSLILKSGARTAPAAQVRVRRESLNGTCLRAHARLTATLVSPLDIGRP
jgi:hypothetical protein